MSRLREILDLARWAPSGDNSQPWRFEIRSDRHVVVHVLGRELGVYDLDGRASHVSIGAMLETMRIAASTLGCTLNVVPRHGATECLGPIDVWLEDGARLATDPLHAYIRERSVQRKPLSTRALGSGSKLALEKSVGDGFQVIWFEGWRQRLRLTWLAVRSAKIRLTIPEAYAVHRQIIEWDARYSEDRIPDQALGADPLTVRSMRWVLASWPRVRLMNRYFGGTWGPRLQLEFIPGLRCAAHFVILARSAPGSSEDRLATGAAVQRFWLTATSLALQLQPQYTPIVFADYARNGVAFTVDEEARSRAVAVAQMLNALLGESGARRAVFLGRLGSGAAPLSRSLRLPLDRLEWTEEDRSVARA